MVDFEDLKAEMKELYGARADEVDISGVYIKFEIHIFASPLLDSYFCPKGNLL